LDLNEEIGEKLCDKCKGSGVIEDPEGEDICPKCMGYGKLDWVEQITGVKRIQNIWNYLAMPKIRDFYPKKMAKELANVQPINFPKEEKKWN